MAGRSSSAIWSWVWPSRVRCPASSMMIWNTPASAMPWSLAICGVTVVVSLIAVAKVRLAVEHLEREPVHGRADRGEVAELASPLLGGVAADPVDGVEHAFADGCRRGRSGFPRADPPIELFLEVPVEIGDQLLLGLKVVVDGLF